MKPSRRSFLAGLPAAATALAVLPDRLFSSVPPRPSGAPANAVPDLSQVAWQDLRDQFLIPRDVEFFNTGTLGSQPKVVLDAVTEHMTHIVRDIGDCEYRPGTERFLTGYDPEIEMRTKLAALMNVDPEEVALTQNATMGMSFVANGLDLGPGDEVIVLENSHTGGRGGWELRQKRFGPRVHYVPPPMPAESPEQLVALYEDATTPQTRVWVIPHITSGNGSIRFPVDTMCARARERGILSVVDGAQTLGQLVIDLRAMGCDAFISSPHKWMLAPIGTGVLYVRRELQDRIWATLASHEWDNYQVGLYRLMQFGTGNLSLLVGLDRAVDFYNSLGPARVEQRIVGLADRLRAGLDEIDGVYRISPRHPALLSAMTIYGIEGMTGDEIQDELWEREKIRVRRNGDGVRQCCHVYNSEDGVDRTLEVLAALASRRG